MTTDDAGGSADRAGGLQTEDVRPVDVSRELLERVRRREPTGDHLRVMAGFTDGDLEAVRTEADVGLAFWLNCYNAATQLLLDRRPALFDTRWRFFRAEALTVAGVGLSLDDIEHGILRGGRSKYGLGYLPRLARTGLPRGYRLSCDPRIHFVLNCGAASCPPIRVFAPAAIDRTLEDATGAYLEREVEYDADRDRVRVPRVCLWNLGDFGGLAGIRELVRRHGLIPPDAHPAVRFDTYDWTRAPGRFVEDG